MKKPFHYKKLLQYFLQGLLILAPVAITAYSIFWVVSSIDSWLPIFTYIDKNGLVHVRNYGIGFVIIIVALIVIGYFSSLHHRAHCKFYGQGVGKNTRYQVYLFHHA